MNLSLFEVCVLISVGLVIITGLILTAHFKGRD